VPDIWCYEEGNQRTVIQKPELI